MLNLISNDIKTIISNERMNNEHHKADERDKLKDENEKNLAIIARDALQEKILNKIVKLHCYD